MLRRRKLTVTAAGAAGTASGSLTTRFSGRVLAVRLDYSAAAPATTDVTVTDADGQQIVNRANSAVDTLLYPRVLGTDNAGVAIAAGNNGYEPYAVAGVVTIAVAQANPGDTVDVTFLTEE